MIIAYVAAINIIKCDNVWKYNIKNNINIIYTLWSKYYYNYILNLLTF